MPKLSQGIFRMSQSLDLRGGYRDTVQGNPSSLSTYSSGIWSACLGPFSNIPNLIIT
jgi:hypothetical protein